MDAPSFPKWHAVRCRPRQELIARVNLERQHFVTLLPYVTRNLGKIATEIMFPGYIFLERSHEEQSLASVRSTRGCIDLVRFGMLPAEVPPAVIDSLRAYDGAQQPMLIDDFAGLMQGDALAMVGGGFEGQKAVFVKADSMERIRVLLTILGQEREIVVRRESVRKIA